MLQLDLDQLKLVYEALHERDRLLANAAHLARPLPILTVSFALGAYLWRLEHHFRLHACAALGKQLACALHVLSVWQAQYQKLAMSTPSNLFTDPACNPPPPAEQNCVESVLSNTLVFGCPCSRATAGGRCSIMELASR